MNVSNYPDNFKGIEGEEEETFTFFLTGEVDVEHYSEEAAEDDFMDMTVRELLQKGIHLD